MPWHLPERDTHEVPTPGGHQDDGEAGGDDAGDGPTDGDRTHEGGGEPSHYGLESAFKNRYIFWMISLVVITCKDRVVYIEQDTERERQEIKPKLPGVRVYLGEDDWGAKDDRVEDEGEYYPRPRRISGSEDNVDEVSEAVG